jgi:hypothetical protein
VAEVTVSGNKKISTLQKEFNNKFPFLTIKFFAPKEWEKSKSGGTISPLSSNQTLAKVRTKKPEKNSEISIHGRTKIGNLEENFMTEYGLYAQVCYKAKNASTDYYTSGSADDKSLTQFNKFLSENGGYEKGPC